eukprot:765360-Hanusia_phi.AAC.3
MIANLRIAPVNMLVSAANKGTRRGFHDERGSAVSQGSKEGACRERLKRLQQKEYEKAKAIAEMLLQVNPANQIVSLSSTMHNN